MGSVSSKMGEKDDKPVEVDGETGNVPSTPILTPRKFRENLERNSLDPRSPTKHIVRTPVEILATRTEELTLHSQLPPIETPNKTHLHLGIDPRSPTLELTRTPIIVNNSPKAPLRLRNKNLEKVKNSAILSCLQSKHPKLLDTPKMNVKRKSILLETNVDYTETDLDQVLHEKYPELVGVDDPRSPSLDIARTPIQVKKEEDEEVVEVEPLQPDPESVQFCQDILQEIVNSIKLTPPPQLKKLTKLIYEDQDTVVTPRSFKTQKCRTPLTLRNENQCQSSVAEKKAPKLKVSDFPRKSEGGSKIPVFKEKKIRVQCENTPPRAMRVPRNKKPQWDCKDDTMVI